MLNSYINLIFDAFLPPLLLHGIAFEAHGQNTLARFNKQTGLLTGFVFRDFGGLRIHTPTLLASTGVVLDILPGHCIVVSDVREAYKHLYHNLIELHLHRLIRVLGFHHNGQGWELVRRSLESRIPRESDLWDAWLNPERTTVMGKCIMQMKLEGLHSEVGQCVSSKNLEPEGNWTLYFSSTGSVQSGSESNSLSTTNGPRWVSEPHGRTCGFLKVRLNAE